MTQHSLIADLDTDSSTHTDYNTESVNYCADQMAALNGDCLTVSVSHYVIAYLQTFTANRSSCLVTDAQLGVENMLNVEVLPTPGLLASQHELSSNTLVIHNHIIN